MWAGVALVIGLTAELGGQQELLARVRTLYTEARYEEALAAIEEIPHVAAATEQPLAEYQALCLLALNRIIEAERLVEHIFALNPLYRPIGDVPPRFVALVARVRSEFLPGLIRKWFSDGTAAVGERRYELANALFDLIRDVLKAAGQDPALSAVADDLMPQLTRLQQVSRAFAAVPRLPDPPATAVTNRPQDTHTQAGPGVTPSVLVLQALPEATSVVTNRPRDIYTQVDSGVTPPVPVRQMLPEASVLGHVITTPLEGELELVIGPTGTVQSAHLRRPIHPAYDPLLLKAAQQWTYRPAIRNGEPVTYRAVMTLQLSSPTASH
jgi:hypothetical protein